MAAEVHQSGELEKLGYLQIGLTSFFIKKSNISLSCKVRQNAEDRRALAVSGRETEGKRRLEHLRTAR